MANVVGVTASQTTIQAIAILGGSGALGSGLALRWARAGYKVMLGSRDAARAAEKALELRAQSGGDVLALSYADAAAAADIIVLAAPFKAQQEVLSQVKDQLAGKILVDCTAPLVPPKVTRVQMPEEGSAGIRAQRLLGDGVRVVSAFQNVSAGRLRDLQASIDCDVLVCGDDPDARAVVVELVGAAGMRGVVAGPLANSVAAEAMTSLLIFINRHYECHDAGVRITGLAQAKVRHAGE